MTGLIIFMAVAVVAVAFVWWKPRKKQESVEASFTEARYYNLKNS